MLYTGLFEMIVEVLITCRTQYTVLGVYVFYYLIEQHSSFVTYRIGALHVHPLGYESEPQLKPSPLTCNSIMVLMFVESQSVHI